MYFCLCVYSSLLFSYLVYLFFISNKTLIGIPQDQGWGVMIFIRWREWRLYDFIFRRFYLFLAWCWLAAKLCSFCFVLLSNTPWLIVCFVEQFKGIYFSCRLKFVFFWTAFKMTQFWLCALNVHMYIWCWYILNNFGIKIDIWKMMKEICKLMIMRFLWDFPS